MSISKVVIGASLVSVYVGRGEAAGAVLMEGSVLLGSSLGGEGVVFSTTRGSGVVGFKVSRLTLFSGVASGGVADGVVGLGSGSAGLGVVLGLDSRRFFVACARFLSSSSSAES